MTNENTKPTGHYEDAAIPAHLVDSVRALGAAVAARGLPDPKSSPEDLARLVDRLQKTFGAGTGKSGQVAPPPSPFVMEYGAEVKEKEMEKEKEKVQEKGKEKRNARYHVQVEEVEDEHWLKR